MSDPLAPKDEAQAPARPVDPASGEIDWQAIEATPEFQELVRRRRSFVLPATIFFLVWYMGFILLTAYSQDLMRERVYQGLTVGYCLALTQFVMVLVLGILYLRRSDKVYDPLAEKAIERWVHMDTDEARAERSRAATTTPDEPA